LRSGNKIDYCPIPFSGEDHSIKHLTPRSNPDNNFLLDG